MQPQETSEVMDADTIQSSITSPVETNAPQAPEHVRVRAVVHLGTPGDVHCGRGVNQALDVIRILDDHSIPSCVVGVKALVYYGSYRVPIDWEICVPTEQFDQAIALFTSSPLTETYEVWHPIQPQLRSLVHTYPHFHLRGVEFYFILMPTFDCLVDPNPDLCEKSHSGIPYPKLEPFARSLLGTQNYSDLEDLIDAMDLTAEWGNEHLPLDDPPDREYLEKKNAMFEAALPEDLPGGRLGLLSLSPRPRREWEKMVGGKQRRIGDETPRERFITRFRKVGSGDPRENTRREV